MKRKELPLLVALNSSAIKFLTDLEKLEPSISGTKNKRVRPNNPYTVDCPEVKQMTQDFYQRAVAKCK